MHSNHPVIVSGRGRRKHSRLWQMGTWWSLSQCGAFRRSFEAGNADRANFAGRGRPGQGQANAQECELPGRAPKARSPRDPAETFTVLSCVLRRADAAVAALTTPFALLRVPSALPGFLAAFPKLQTGFAAFAENAEVKKWLGPAVPAYFKRA